MTDEYAPASTPPQRGESLPPAPAEEQGTADVVKDQAAGLSHGSVEAGKHVAEVAREQASGVAAEAGRQGRDLLEQTQHQLETQAAQGQQRLAKQLLSLSDELRSMARGERPVRSDCAAARLAAIGRRGVLRSGRGLQHARAPGGGAGQGRAPPVSHPASKGAGLLAGAGISGHLVLLFASVAAWWAIGEATGRGWSALIVAAAWLIIAAVLGLMGRREISAVPGVAQTTQTVKKIPDAVRGNEGRSWPAIRTRSASRSRKPAPA